ncbi:MAG: PKD domain-containing protein [Methanomassiliicoccales archaeon]
MSSRVLTVGMLILLCLPLLALSPGSQGEESLGEEISLLVEFDTPRISHGSEGRISIPDLYSWSEVGGPLLPVKGVKVPLPTGAEVDGISWEAEEIPLGNVGDLPVREGYRSTGDSLSSLQTGHPSERVEFRGVHTEDGRLVALFNIWPVGYDSASGTASYCPSVEITVQTLQGEERIVEGALEPGAYEYVIVTSQSLEGSFQDLVEWKQTRGLDYGGNITARLVTVEWIMAQEEYWGDPGAHGGTGNDTQTLIRNFVVDAHRTWGTEFLLLGGDHEIIPCRRVPVEGPMSDLIPTDLYYMGLDGDWDLDDDGRYGEGAGRGGGSSGEEADLIPEVWAGRATVSTSWEAGNFVNKVISYESSDHHRLNTSLLVGQRLDLETWGGDYKDEVAALTFPDWLLEGTERLYERDDGFSSEKLIDSINRGVHLINHMGHGTEDNLADITHRNIGELNNTLPSVMFSQACLVGAFDNPTREEDAIAEQLISGEHGAVAAIVNSRQGWYSRGDTDGPSQRFDIEFFDALLQEGIRQLGRALGDTRSDLVSLVGDTGTMRWCYMTLNLLGDPETEVHFQGRTEKDVAVENLEWRDCVENRPCRITSEVVNRGRSDAPSVEVELTVNGNSVQLINMSLPALSSGTAELSWTPPSPGLYELRVRAHLADDQVPTNDEMRGMAGAMMLVENHTILSNGTLSCPTGLMVGEGGNLSLENHTLALSGPLRVHGGLSMNGSSVITDGQITSSPGSHLELRDSTLDSSGEISLRGDLTMEGADLLLHRAMVVENATMYLEGTTVRGGGLSIGNCSLQISDIWVEGAPGGLTLEGSSGSVSRIHVNGSLGMGLYGCADLSVRDATVRDCRHGLIIEDSASVQVSNSTFLDNGWDLGINGTSREHFEHSFLSSNVTGGEILYLQDRHGAEVNRSTRAGYIALIFCSDVLVEGQTLRGNLQGMRVVDSSGITVTDCLVTGNMEGIDLMGSEDCTIHGNHFSNPVDVRDDRDSRLNLSYPEGGNFYDRYQGEDLSSGEGQDRPDPDGIGDHPHDLPEAGVDRYPLMRSPVLPNEGPIADFHFSPDSPLTFQEVDFVDTSLDPQGELINWTWEMGDGTVLHGSQVTHSFVENGDHTVTLTVMDDSRQNSSANRTVAVDNRVPQGQFDHTPQFPRVGEEVAFRPWFQDEDGTVVSHRWDFGDGNHSDEREPSHAFTSKGVFQVTLSLEDDDGGVFTATGEVVVGNDPPVADFRVDPEGPTTLEEVRFQDLSHDPDGSVSGWRWDLGDGGTSRQSSPSHIYQRDGTFTVTLTVEDDHGMASSSSVRLEVSNSPPMANFTHSQGPVSGEPVNFTDLSRDPDGSIVSWVWNFGDGNGSTDPSPNHCYWSTGTFTVTLTVEDDDGSTHTFSRPLVVGNAPPRANFDLPGRVLSRENLSFVHTSTDPDGEVVSHRWDFGDGNLSSERNASHSYSRPGDYTVTLTVEDDRGAVDSLSRRILVDNRPPVADFTWSASWEGEPMLLLSSGSTDLDGHIVGWTWEIGEETLVGREVSHPLQGGIDAPVTLTVEDDNGEESSCRKLVTTGPPELSVELSSLPLGSGVVDLSLTVSNLGDSDAEGVSVVVLLDGSQADGWSIDVPAGEARDLNLSLQLGPGDHEVVAIVDENGEFVESEKSNNSVTVRLSGEDEPLSPWLYALPVMGMVVLAGLLIRRRG